MSEQTTVLDRYIGLADRAVGHPEVIGELRTIFAEDATVQVFEDEINGIDAIIEFYQGFIGSIEEGKHYWTTARLSDGVLEARWVGAFRFKGDRLMGVGGVERAQVNSEGLITHLRNYPTPAG